MKYHIKVIQSDKFCYINAISDETKERIGKVCIEFNSNDSIRYIKSFSGKFAKIIIVETSSKYICQGIATALLNKAIEVLKDYNLYLNVIPQKRNNNDKDKKSLINFYNKFGFTRYDNDICITTMIRQAS